MGGIQFVPFDSGMDMNSKYLTNEMAYFLGGIYASEEEVNTPNGNYKIAPVRYNYGAASEMELISHYELVKKMANRLNGYINMAENIRKTSYDTGKNKMPGFSTFFKSVSLGDIRELIPRLDKALDDSDPSVRRAFLVGVFDGRSSADINRNNFKIRMLSLDCISDDVGAFLSSRLQKEKIVYNYNTHRDRLEGGKPRNPQLRIKDVDYFISKVGLISPRRINLLKNAYEHNYDYVQVVENDDILNGLKTIQVR